MTIEAFEWDEGNKEKNLIKHKVTMEECEQVFQNSVYLIIEDLTHSQDEERYSMLGSTNAGRKLQIIYTIRQTKVRVISARDQNKKEGRQYEKTDKANKT